MQKVTKDKIILAFDTATAMLTVAVGDGHRVLAEKNLLAPRAHMSLLLPNIKEVLDRARISLEQVDCLVVGTGPGSYTGLRIGVATAQGLANATGKPLLGISTLDSLAYPLRSYPHRLLPVIDAKRKEVYASLYEGSNNSKPCRILDYQVLSPLQLCQRIKREGDKVLFTGDALIPYYSIFQRELREMMLVADEKYWYPRARSLIAQAQENIISEAYFRVLPIYIRLSDAEEVLKRKEQS